MVTHLFQDGNPPFQLCSATFPRTVTHLFQDGHPPFPVCLPTFPRIVTHLSKDSSPSYQGRSPNFSFYWDGHPPFPAWPLGDVNFVWYHALSISRISNLKSMDWNVTHFPRKVIFFSKDCHPTFLWYCTLIVTRHPQKGHSSPPVWWLGKQILFVLY